MGSPLTSEEFVRLLDKNLREVSENSIEELHQKENMIPKLYRTINSDSATEEFYDIGAVPDIVPFNGKISYLSVAPGYYTKIEPKEYAGGLIAERKLIDDKKYAVLDDRARMLMESGHRVEQKTAVRPFAYAFSSAFDYMQSEEGVSLCSDSHTTKAGTSVAAGFDNAGTSALSKTSLAATRILMRKFRNDISERIVIEPDTLIVPDNLYDTALELVKSEKDPTSANNTINTQVGRWTVLPWLRLDDYDTNNWFMCDSKLMKRYLVWINRIALESKNTVDFETYSLKQAVYGRWGNGFINWRWIFGHNVT